ncbi:MAG: hypothetical protein HY075_03285 [Deltaproteobacteria bacterium]|nr:hypothetical protein [Deltaproteobacteria bacterium]
MTSTTTPEFWRKCSSCKKPLPFAQRYYVCSVSTCNRVRTGLVFCSVACVDAHIPMMNHKDAGAIEKRAPTLAEWQRDQAEAAAAAARPAPAQAASSPSSVQAPYVPPTPTGDLRRDILIVVSKTKDYVRAKSGLNTSDGVMEVLSDKLRAILDEAIRRAIQDERKTLLDRDLK